MAERPSIILRTVCIDCHDPQAMADFYGKLLGWEVTYAEDDFVLMRHPEGGTGVSFQADPGYVPPVWPELPGDQQKMLHLELKVEDLAAATAHAIESGGRLAQHQGREDLRVMLDPAGHPFCLFTI